MDERRRMTQHLISQGVFKDSPMTVVDIGVCGGPAPCWSVYGDQLRLIGFEPSEDECERLAKAHPGGEFLPYAVGFKDERKRAFHHTLHPNASSFYKPDWTKAGRYPFKQTLTVSNISAVRTVNLQSALANIKAEPDFIKLDCEGAELEVLEGLWLEKSSQEVDSVLGVSVEALFTPIRYGQPAFRDVDVFLAHHGFTLFDIATYRHTRKTLSPDAFTSRQGQVLWAQTLYFRDLYTEIESKKWQTIHILKLASLFEVHRLSDCAIELVQEAFKHLLLDGEQTCRLVNLLTPKIDGKEVTYKAYWHKLRQAVNVRTNPKNIHAAYRHWIGRTYWG